MEANTGVGGLEADDEKGTKEALNSYSYQSRLRSPANMLSLPPIQGRDGHWQEYPFQCKLR